VRTLTLATRDRRLFFFLIFDNCEVDAATHHFFQSDARVFVFQRIDFNAWARPALKLFTSFGGKND